MYQKAFPVIDLIATGDNIRRLRLERGLSVRDLQGFFGFDQPQAIYKWQKGASLPTVDNLYALGILFGVPMEQILVPAANVYPHSHMEQQAEACCSCFLWVRRPTGGRPAANVGLDCRGAFSPFRSALPDTTGFDRAWANAIRFAAESALRPGRSPGHGGADENEIDQ